MHAKSFRKNIFKCLLAFGIMALPLVVFGESPMGHVHTWMAPKSADRKINPIPASTESESAGKVIYAQSCLACHGPKGEGNGPAAAFLNKHPGIFSDPKLWNQSDGALFWKISHGNSPMPNFAPTLKENQIWQVIDFIRTLSTKPKESIPTESSSK